LQQIVGRRRRNSLEIIHEVLRAASKNGGATKTGLVYSTNSTFQRTTQIVEHLLRLELLHENSSQGVHRYCSTARGIELQKNIELLFESLEMWRSDDSKNVEIGFLW
jgi:predicted transcriptional regulator